MIILRITMSSLALSKLKKRTPLEKLEKPKKKIDRFDGLSEEEVQKYTLSDYLEMNLDMVFVGINPSLMAAYRGRYYAGPGNHFYKLLHESGLVPRFISFEEDHKLLQHGIGLTNIVSRATRSSADLKRTELKEGAKIVEEKLKYYKPKIAIFNGKCIYEAFANKTGKFNFGLQPERIGSTAIWVIPSSSARCANFPRMCDKLHFYTALKKYLQFSKGEITDVDAKEFLFEGKCKPFIPTTSKMWRRKNVSTFLHGGRIANKNVLCMDTSDENIAIAYSTEFIVKEIKSDLNDEHDVELINNKIEGIQSAESVESQDNTMQISKSCIDLCVENPKVMDEMMNDKKHVDLCELSNNNINGTHKSIASKLRTNSHKSKIKTKKLSPKPVKERHCVRNTSLDFVNLIKQRLQEKTVKESKPDEEIHN